MSSTRAIVKTIELRCSIEHAFQSFIAKVDDWWPPSHRVLKDSHIIFEPKTGGRFYARAKSGIEEKDLGIVLDFQPPTFFSYTWYPGSVTLPTKVAVSFKSQGDGVLMTVTHSEGGSGLGEQWPQRAVLFEKSWTQVLQNYENFINNENEKDKL